MAIRVPVVLAALLLGAPAALPEAKAQAASAPTGAAMQIELGKTNREIVLRPQISDVLSLPRPARTIILGDPTIADATLDGDSVLVLTGQKVGRTNLIIIDAAGQEVVRAALRVRPGEGRVVVRQGATVKAYTCTPACTAD